MEVSFLLSGSKCLGLQVTCLELLTDKMSYVECLSFTHVDRQVSL